MLFDADGVIQGARPGWMEDLTAWGGSRAEEFLLAIAAADVACLTGKDFGAAMRDVLRQFEIDAPLEEVIDRQFWIEVRQPMLDAVRAVRDLGLHCGLATNQQNLRGGVHAQFAWLRDDLRRAVLLVRTRVCETGGRVFSGDHGPHRRCTGPSAVH